MSIVTFWNNGKEETGKTLSLSAIATYLAVEHNYRILLISTGYSDESLNRCFWKEKKEKRNLGLFGPNTNVGMEDGIIGLSKAIKSNKISSENITNYTKIVFKDRLEILQSYKGVKTQYEEIKKIYPDIINLANNYYDLVFVDLDVEVQQDIIDMVLSNSNLIVANIAQRLSSIDEFIKLKEETKILKSKKTLILVGRYDKFSKYTAKNISRYMKERNLVSTIPYNTLFFEAADEGRVPDLFMSMKNVDEDDRNKFFISEVKKTADNIMYRLQDISIKM